MKDENRLVCRSVRYTGTRVPERICETKRRMKNRQETARNTTDKIFDRDRKNGIPRDVTRITGREGAR